MRLTLTAQVVTDGIVCLSNTGKLICGDLDTALNAGQRVLQGRQGTKHEKQFCQGTGTNT
jgi:hypothetical protein